MIKSSSIQPIGVFAIAAIISMTTARFTHAAPVDPQILAARSQANSADIEQVVLIAKQTADKIGTGEIVLTTVNTESLAKFMADAVAAKLSTAAGSQRPDNKADEIGEIAAFITDGIIPNPTFKNLKTVGNPNVLAVLRGTLSNAKKTAELLVNDIVRDVVGSVALTIRNSALLTDRKKEKILAFLLANKRFIAGKLNKGDVKAGLLEGFSGSPAANLAYEDGNIDALGAITDPETDIRNA